MRSFVGLASVVGGGSSDGDRPGGVRLNVYRT